MVSEESCERVSPTLVVSLSPAVKDLMRIVVTEGSWCFSCQQRELGTWKGGDKRGDGRPVKARKTKCRWQ